MRVRIALPYSVCARHFFGETDSRREFKYVEPMELIADFDLGWSLGVGVDFEGRFRIS